MPAVLRIAGSGRLHPLLPLQDLRTLDDQSEQQAMPRGAPGTRTFSFEPVAAGETVLRLVKKRSWEATAAEEYTVTLSVL